MLSNDHLPKQTGGKNHSVLSGTKPEFRGLIILGNHLNVRSAIKCCCVKFSCSAVKTATPFYHMPLFTPPPWVFQGVNLHCSVNWDTPFSVSFLRMYESIHAHRYTSSYTRVCTIVDRNGTFVLTMKGIISICISFLLIRVLLEQPVQVTEWLRT